MYSVSVPLFYIFPSLSNVMNTEIFVKEQGINSVPYDYVAIYLTLFSFYLKVLQPLMATAGGMWCLLTSCYIFLSIWKILYLVELSMNSFITSWPGLKVSEYDQEIPQSQATNQPIAPWGRAYLHLL